MKKTPYKRILGVMLLAVLINIFSITNVSAKITTHNAKIIWHTVSKVENEDINPNNFSKWKTNDAREEDKKKYAACKAVIDKFNKEGIDYSFVAERYGVETDLKAINNNKYKITMSKNIDSTLKKVISEADAKAKKNKKRAGLKITKAVFRSLDDNKITNLAIPSGETKLRPGGSISINSPTNGVSGEVTITLVPSGFTDPELKQACAYEVSEYVEGSVVKDGKTLKDKKETTKKVEAPKFEIVITIDDTGRGYITAEKLPADFPKLDTTPIVTSDINCNAGSFEKKFCEARSKAKKVSTDPSKNTTTLTCDVNKVNFKETDAAAIAAARAEEDSGKDVENPYYKNKNIYMYETIETPKDGKGEYVYEYTGNTVKVPVSCKRKCQEVVTVEYGPPIATKAGLCFEYRIKVTSRVYCQAVDTKLPEPKKYAGFCTPSPVCSKGKKSTDALESNYGEEHKQGGPNDDFDDCVVDCDGGKYTDKCSKKCYNKIYGSTKSKTANTTDGSVSQIASAQTVTTGFDYDAGNLIWRTFIGKQQSFREGAKKHGWKLLVETSKTKLHRKAQEIYALDPRWYWTKRGHRLLGSYKCYKYTGIPAVCGCQETCIWLGCQTEDKNSGFYLNPSDPEAYAKEIKEKAKTNNNIRFPSRTFTENKKKYKIEYLKGQGIENYRDNINTYNRVKNACNAAATCSTKSSEYTISAKYNNKWYNFPEGKLADTPGGKPKLGIPKQHNETDSVVRLFGGCYNNQTSGGSNGNNTNKHKEDWYQAAWTFPGTWIHTKTGEISYSPKGDDYVEYKNQFCLPLSQKNVNTKWWNYHYTKKYEDDESISINNPAFQKECASGNTGGTGSCNWKVSSISTSDIKDWNIVGSTRKFGKYSWNFDIKCFYAVNDSICDPDESGKVTNEKCKNQSDDKVIRTVDLKQLFPAGENSASASRDPGYNWTAYAKNTKTTNTSNNRVNNTGSNTSSITNYNSDPIAYTNWVQKKNYSIYSDEYLDYYVELTRDKIKQIKDGSTNINYAAFSGGKTTTNDVITYKSDFLRNTIGAKVPKETSMKCNNIHNYHTDGCETFK